MVAHWTFIQCFRRPVVRFYLLELYRDGLLLPEPRPASDWISGHLTTDWLTGASSRPERALDFEVAGIANPTLARRMRLFDPRLYWISPAYMAFRGFQKGPGGSVVLQEWWLRQDDPKEHIGPRLGEISPSVR